MNIIVVCRLTVGIARQASFALIVRSTVILIQSYYSPVCVAANEGRIIL